MKILDNKNINIIDRIIASIILSFSSMIFPLVIFGIFFNNLLSSVTYLHYSISLLTLIYWIIKYFNKLTQEYEYKFPEFSTIEKIFIFLIFGICVIYLVFMTLYFERGWDALQYYFPNALYFYISNRIPRDLNPFSFYPTFKPPMNTLYITYSLFINSGHQYATGAEIYPFILIMGTVLITYQITYSISQKREISLFASLIFLTTPLTYFLVYEYAFYQEIPVMFSINAVLYFYIKLSKYYTLPPENKSKRIIVFYIILISFSSSLAILSKLTGFLVFFLILFSFSFLKNKIEIAFKSTFIILLGLILALKASLDFYIGYGIIILFLCFFLVYIMMKNTHLNLNIHVTYITFIIPALFAGFWIWFMLHVPGTRSYLISTFFQYHSNDIITSFPIIEDRSTIYIENGNAVSFLSSSLYLFTGSFMGLFWGFHKLIGFLSKPTNKKLYLLNIQIISTLRIFVISFLIFWFTYFATISSRYLTPIIPVLSIFITIGFYQFYSKYMNLKLVGISKLVFIFSGSLLYYPFIPINNIMLSSVNERFYLYHYNQLLLIVYIIIGMIIMLLLTKLEIKYPNSSKSILPTFAILVLIMFSSPQVYIYYNSDFNKTEFNQNMNYFHRLAFNELVEKIIVLDIQLNERILSVNTPGLGYYTSRGVFDLMMLPSDTSGKLLDKYSYNEILQIMEEYNIKLIVKLNSSHTYYNRYNEIYSNSSLLISVKENSDFLLLFFNDEYKLYIKL